MSRPRKSIDYGLVESMAQIHCTQEEIAEVLGISVRTLQRRAKFCRIYKKGREKGKASVRRMQFKSAEKGNVTMQIWLGKQILGQRDTLMINTQDDSVADPLTQSIMESVHGEKPKKTTKMTEADKDAVQH
jgi:hypothetical protein